MAVEAMGLAGGEPLLFLDAAGFRVQDLVAGGGQEYQFRFPRAHSRELTFFDTFEWGIWFRQALLYECGGKVHLVGREADWIGHEVCTEEAGGGAPGFFQDFQSPEMRRELGEVVGLRRLVPVAEVRCAQRLGEAVNASGKIVCRIELATLFPRHRRRSPFYHLCRLLPLKGYDEDSDRVRDILLAHGCAPAGEGPLAALLRHGGNFPRAYTLRPAFDLGAEVPAREAVTRIVRRMLALVAENVPGMLRDQDTEFLHDYRICLRKIRSLLTLIEGVFPDAAADRMKKILSALARATNRLRDLDVWLLARDEYAGMLPAVLQPALREMFADFEAERLQELEKVRLHLKSSPGRGRLRELAGFFESGGDMPPSPSSEVPVGPLVFRRIHKRYRKIRDVDGALGAGTPDAAVHELRIQTKKLRYLLEFFSELLPPGQAVPLEKGLRRLQNRLGRFNDYCVQQKFLLEYWRRKRDGTGDQSGRAMSIGGLIAVLNLKQQTERENIQSALDAFCSPETSALVKRLFKPVPPGDPVPAA